MTREAKRKMSRVKQADKSKAKVQGREKTTTLTNATEGGSCYLCSGNHPLYHCENFLALQVNDRIKEVKRLKLCLNCLRKDHFVKSCRMGSCRECPEKHNTLCHLPTSSDGASESNKVESGKEMNSVATHHVDDDANKKRVLMAMAIVNVRHPNGSIVPLRILLDSASEAHFITYAACNRIGAKRGPASETITGINGIANIVNQCCDVVIRARHSKATAVVHSFVVSKVTKRLPAIGLNRDAIPIPSNIVLADPEFHKQGSIDMLIGAKLFFDLLESGKIELGDNLPIIQNTKFGWIVAGPFISSSVSLLSYEGESVASLVCSSEYCEHLNQNLRQFWELENRGSEIIQAVGANESDDGFRENHYTD